MREAILSLLQVVLALGLLAGALYMLISIRREQAREWNLIMGGITGRPVKLFGLSYGSMFSGGLDCHVDDLWDSIEGVRGLWAIFRNTGILLEAVDYLEKVGKDGPYFAGTLSRLRTNGRRVRIEVANIYLGYLLSLFTGKCSACPVKVTKAYLSLVAHVSIAINDYAPELLRQYQHFISCS